MINAAKNMGVRRKGEGTERKEKGGGEGEVYSYLLVRHVMSSVQVLTVNH